MDSLGSFKTNLCKKMLFTYYNLIVIILEDINVNAQWYLTEIFNYLQEKLVKLTFDLIDNHQSVIRYSTEIDLDYL